MTGGYVNVKAIQTYFSVERDTVYKWAREGCPHIRTGSGPRAEYRFKIAEVERWLQQRNGKDAVQVGAADGDGGGAYEPEFLTG